MINYIIQVLLFQALFLAVYDFFLQKETFFKWNRVYLLATPFISFIIPLLKFDKIQQAVPQEYIVQMPTVFLNPEALIIGTNTNETSIDYFSIIFYLGITVFSLLFLIRLIKIIRLISSNEIIKENIYSLVLLKTKQSAFSFFNYIFINKQLLENKELEIVQHELVHCKQKHSIDLLIFELLKIVLWFNPLIYVYQKRITLLHEYISDAEVVKETDKYTYFNKLLSETFEVESISFTNQFFKHSLIKKRIVMITKERSQKMKQLKYLLIVPLLLGMLIYSSCSDGPQKISNEELNLSQFTYSLSSSDDLVGELKKTHIEYENFLLKNPNFVSWMQVNRKTNIITYSVHSIEEKVPTHLTKTTITHSNGSYVSFMDMEAVRKGEPNLLNKQNEETIMGNEMLLGAENKVDDKNMDGLPFAIIDEVPVFPGCEGTKQQLRVCLQEKISSHINKKFNSHLATKLDLSPGIKHIFVMFKIDKEGNISNVQARAPHKLLQKEAVRVINALPKMIPGKQEGKPVAVKYSLPIAFKVADKKQNEETIMGNEILLGTENKVSDKKVDGLPFAIIDEVPVFPGCEGTKEQLRVCLQEKITSHVNKKFNSNLASKLDLVSGIKHIFVMFKIDKEGIISNVHARAPHKVLQDEAIRVIKALPKMIPGKQEGKPVAVKYSLPIAFKVE